MEFECFLYVEVEKWEKPSKALLAFPKLTKNFSIHFLETLAAAVRCVSMRL